MDNIADNEAHVQKTTLSNTVPEKGILRLYSWSALPSPAMENIYSFLDRQSQCQMSKVCKNWAQEFSSPTVWKSFRCCFPKNNPLKTTCPEIRFALKYGYMFKHVEIVCRNSSHRRSVMWKHLKCFLKAITFHSKLTSITFVYEGFLFGPFKRVIDKEVFMNIMDLLKSQDQLQSIEFSGTDFSKIEAAELFQVISTKNFSTLKSLRLDDFVDDSIEHVSLNPFRIIDPPSAYKLLMNLQTLAISYSEFFEYIIMACFSCTENPNLKQDMGALEHVELFCMRCVGRYQGIPSSTWKSFKKQCPRMEIDLSLLSGEYEITLIHRIVHRHMPIASLICYVDNYFCQTSKILRHIVACQINVFLRKLDLKWQDPAVTNLENELLVLPSSFPNLKNLKLYLIEIYREVGVLETVFKSWLETGTACLKVVEINLEFVMTAEWFQDYFSKLVDEYAPLFQRLGLTLILKGRD